MEFLLSGFLVQGWALIVLAVALLVIAFEYTRKVLQLRTSQMYLREYEAEISGPSIKIFLSNGMKKSVGGLFKAAYKAHTCENIKPICVISNNTEIKTIFENNDILWMVDYSDYHFEKLKQDNTPVELFVDSSLPGDSAKRAIDELGLRNYMLRIGICDEKGL